LIIAQLEHVIPFVGVVKVDRTPTFPDLDKVCVIVTVVGGSVIGCDTDQRDCIEFSDVTQAFQVTAYGVPNVKSIVRVPVVAL